MRDGGFLYGSTRTASREAGTLIGIDAVLLDLDGTLVDSEPVWIRAEQDLAASFGGCWTHEQGVAQVGRHVSETALELQRAGVALSVDEIVDALTSRVLAELAEPRWRPGAEAFMASLREAEIPCALVTSSPQSIAEVVAAAVPANLLSFVVSGADVVNRKPHPEPYQLALRIMGARADHSIAIEDSPFGIASAHAAGIKVVAVPFMTDIDPASVWRHWSTLAGRTVFDLTA